MAALRPPNGPLPGGAEVRDPRWDASLSWVVDVLTERIETFQAEGHDEAAGLLEEARHRVLRVVIGEGDER